MKGLFLLFLLTWAEDFVEAMAAVAVAVTPVFKFVWKWIVLKLPLRGC